MNESDRLSPTVIYSKYDFQWDVLDVIIAGKSMIDSQMGLSGFPMRSIEDADRFMRSYGYQLDDPIEMAEVQGHIQEAISFIRRNFLQPENPDGLKLEIPRKILEVTDVRDLLLMASHSYPGQMNDSQGLLLQNWACSVLKIVHTVAHIDKDLRSAYFADVQKQILDRFYKVIHRTAEGKLFLGRSLDDPYGIQLVGFETKPKKSRESTLLKLLHKRENVAEDIFDQVGIRFVTENRLDTLRTVKFLKDSMLVMPANIKPSRSRNTLLNFSAYKEVLPGLLSALDRGSVDERGVREKLEEVSPLPEETAAIQASALTVSDERAVNQHSSDFYRSMQFTCRQLIKLRNPLYDDLKDIKAMAKKKVIDEEVNRAIERIDLQYLQREVRFFYPYEIQIMDRQSAEENEKGRSAHREYKKAQIQTAMRRVLGGLISGTS